MGASLTAAFLPVSMLLAQDKPLTRTFVNGTTESYQVLVSVRAETHGVSTETIGEKTYVKPFAHEAAGRIQWQSTRRIDAVKEDGSAMLEENLNQFQSECGARTDVSATDPQLQKSLQELCDQWGELATSSYEEGKDGLIRGLPMDTANMSVRDSSLLSLWLRRAFRPSVIFPLKPIHFGARTEHRVEEKSGSPDGPVGLESTEWVEAGSESPAATLHVSQYLSWMGPARKSGSSNVNGSPPERQLFYADSLNTVSLLDGSLLNASRSASYETKKVLDPVPGLPDAPEFGSKLTITVTMRRLP